MLMLIRQVEPGKRLRVGFFINNEFLPVPDAESVVHALFEIATHREPVPPNSEMLGTLIEKYTAHGGDNV